MVAITKSNKFRRRAFLFFGNLRKSIDHFFAKFLPKGLYARTLIIIIAPIVLLQSVLTFVFMERHWEKVTHRLSTVTSQDISMLVSLYEKSSKTKDEQIQLRLMARENLGLSLRFLPKGKLPDKKPLPYFDLLDRTLSRELERRIEYPFWLDTVGRSRHVEVRIKLEDSNMAIIVLRSKTHASNSHIFIVWMFGTSFVLLTIAILFMRNQIKPILRLAEAAREFGMGRPIPKDFKARGAREVRQATLSFIDMKDRIEKHVEQRTIMLAGVSHDLRTILTRFKFQLAMLKDSPETEALQSDIKEMQHMLEDYMAFTKGDNGEETSMTDLSAFMEDIASDAEMLDKKIKFDLQDTNLLVLIRRNSFKRAIMNLITNAARYAENIKITVQTIEEWIEISVEDDGPGIPVDKREDVFRPFYRIDSSRNQDVGNTGLGLSITRDIINAHGGEVKLEESPTLGGLRAHVRIPV